MGSRSEGSRYNYREAVAAALDHAKIAQGPGGPAEMVPGKRHGSMNMYIGVAKAGQYEIAARSAGLVEPKECRAI
ncbi:hypothetical protein ACRQ5Q_08930 [Bradyrhizobium sp. PMVTL-01]|uniref:hypothetical protein n=1 Tax=Bradyrhizobium sp. PMVTL-01 TaxID=3434999 RepID=UPI003F71D9A2